MAVEKLNLHVHKNIQMKSFFAKNNGCFLTFSLYVLNRNKLCIVI